MSKYFNQRTVVDGLVFDSKREAYRWQELKLMERCGNIKELKRQVPFELIPKCKRHDGSIQRATKYVADFVYYDISKQRHVVEDSKGIRTKEYEMKKKLMLWLYNIEIQEV